MIARQSHDRFLANLGVYETTLEEVQKEIKGYPVYWFYDYWGYLIGRFDQEYRYEALVAKPYEDIVNLSPTDYSCLV